MTLGISDKIAVRMSLECTFFKHDYHYKVGFVNKCISIIRFAESDKRRSAFCNLVFKMMKDIVKKNIANYLNLLSFIADKEVIPSRDELIAESYIIFDKCIEKYRLDNNFNFYFYFNKSLSRNFFRKYRKEALKYNNSVRTTNILMSVDSHFHDSKQLDTVELLVSCLDLTDIERRICQSKLIGQKSAEFLLKNKDVSELQYSKGLRRIKQILLEELNKKNCNGI